jgi:hypothetical protein
MTDQQRVFLWAALGTPDASPSRLEVASCGTCSALVPVAQLDAHLAWHVEAAR